MTLSKCFILFHLIFVLCFENSWGQSSEKCRVHSKLDESCRDSSPVYQYKKYKMKKIVKVLKAQSLTWWNSYKKIKFKEDGTHIRRMRIKGNKQKVKFYRKGLPIQNGKQYKSIIDEIHTGPRESIIIDLSNGHELTIGPNQKVKLHEKTVGNLIVLKLVLTKGWVNIKKTIKSVNSSKRFIMEVSKSATIAIRGTEFQIEYISDYKFKVTLKEGAIDVIDANSQNVSSLKPGNSKIITLGKISQLENLKESVCSCRDDYLCASNTLNKYKSLLKSTRFNYTPELKKIMSKLEMCIADNGVPRKTIDYQLGRKIR